MQDRNAPDLGSDVPGVGGQDLKGRRRTPHQGAIDEGLVAEGERAQRRGERDGDQKVGTGQQPRAMPLQPARGLVPAALRAMAIAAGVIPIHLAAAGRALRALAAAGRRPTRHEVAQGTRLTREQTCPKRGA